MYNWKQFIILGVGVGMSFWGRWQQTSQAQHLATDGKAKSSVEYAKESLETVKDLVAKKKAVLIDVRTDREWNKSHLKSAEFYPMALLMEPGPDRDKALAKLDKSKPIFVHCKVGGRAGRCAQVLTSMGYDARPLKVNYASFEKAGFEVVTPPAK